MNIGDTVRVIALFGEDWHHGDRGKYLGSVGEISMLNDDSAVVVFGKGNKISELVFFTENELELTAEC